MNETPESLRELTDRFDGHTSLADEENIRLHADAWELERVARYAIEEKCRALEADNAALLELLNMAQNRALDWEKRFYCHVFNNGEMAGEEYFARESNIERRRVAIGRRNEDEIN